MSAVLPSRVVTVPLEVRIRELGGKSIAEAGATPSGEGFDF